MSVPVGTNLAASSLVLVVMAERSSEVLSHLVGIRRGDDMIV